MAGSYPNDGRFDSLSWFADNLMYKQPSLQDIHPGSRLASTDRRDRMASPRSFLQNSGQILSKILCQNTKASPWSNGMAKKASSAPPPDLIQTLTQKNFLFRDLDPDWLAGYLTAEQIVQEKLFSSRPIYTAFRPDRSLEFLYLILSGGPVVVHSTPLNRVISMTYPGGCFGMRNLPFGYGQVARSFPSLVEAYKTTDVAKIPWEVVNTLHQESEIFRERYGLLFELREKFQYHLLNCSTYPPQAVAALLRALVYQERSLKHQPNADGVYTFDLAIDIIAHACQLNHRTVEQVLKGMTKVGLIQVSSTSDTQGDVITVLNAEGLKEVYGATRDKVDWWPLR